MSLLELIGLILIGPLKLLFEIVFSIAYQVFNHTGIAIIALSLAMNVVVLPLYRRADAIQIEARDTENKLKDVVTHIKKTFSGDEQMMILQTYYRQNNYNPLSVLSGSVSLMLEIPFFMAAYQFLSGSEILSGSSFGPIADLSVPDALLNIGGVAINVLPVIMTLINIISSALYLKGFPLKTKIQLYGMALFFLVFLYNSPAALVLYWTLNNLFSLLKNLFVRVASYDSFIKALFSITGVALISFGILQVYSGRLDKYSILPIIIGLMAQLPLVFPVLKKIIPVFNKQVPLGQPNTKIFVISAVFLAVLVGLLIPSTYIAASPQEYINPSYFYNPVWHVLHSLCMSVGVFVVWMGVFYWLADSSSRSIFARLVVAMSGIMLVDYMFFGTQLGIVSADLQFAWGFNFTRNEQLINCTVVFLLGIALYLLARKSPNKVFAGLLVGTIALTGMSAIHINKIIKTAEETKVQISDATNRIPSFSMSKDGKNVVVIMLDRGIGPFIPYLMEENPELLKQFDGFTYYSNSLSYGGHTNLSAPALYGGYEYTPVNINLRNNELLVDKHNEALKVVPTIFAEAGYDVTVIDPSLAGYQWTPDLSIYDDIPGIQTFLADGLFTDEQSKIDTILARNRNFFVFSLMKTLPVPFQRILYNGGTYRSVTVNITVGMTEFLNAYNVLKNMSEMTNIKNDDNNTYMFLRSNITHAPLVLQEPTFEPASFVDNRNYYPSRGKTISDGSKSFLLDNEHQISHYHVNMAALMQLGNWFDYLRENNVYNNTRIIIVSDHGVSLDVFDHDEFDERIIEYYMPMLLVKDFDATGYSTSDVLMTNADVPYLSLEGLFASPANPFTNKVINCDQKTQNDKHYVTLSDDYDCTTNNGYQFSESAWASVSGEIGNKNNWVFYPQKTTLPAEIQN